MKGWIASVQGIRQQVLPGTQHVQTSTLSSDSVLYGIFFVWCWCFGKFVLFAGLRGLWACADFWLNESWAGLACSIGALHILCAQYERAEWVKEWVTTCFERSEEKCGDRMQPMCHKSLGCMWSSADIDICEDSSLWPKALERGRLAGDLWAGLLWGHSYSPLSSATGFKRELTTCFSISSATILRTVLFCFPFTSFWPISFRESESQLIKWSLI